MKILKNFIKLVFGIPSSDPIPSFQAVIFFILMIIVVILFVALR